jgi:hypothetical protein
MCYQVYVRFTFRDHRPVLASVTTSRVQAPPYLVETELPFGIGHIYRRFFSTESEAARYVAYLRTSYAGRTLPPCTDSQLSLFQEVSE